VFVKDAKSVADSEQIPSFMNTDNSMIQHRECVQTVSATFCYAKVLHFFHSDILRYTMNDLSEIFELLMKISKYALSIFQSEHSKHNKSIQIFSSLIQIIKEYSGLRCIELILNQLESLIDALDAPFQEVTVSMIRGLQLYSISIELKSVTDIHEYITLKALQLKHSNLITIIVIENSVTSEFIANGSRLLVHVCDVHVEHCDQVLSDSNLNSVDLSEALTFLQSDVIFMERLQKNEPLPIFNEIMLKLQARVLSLLTAMQQLYILKHGQPTESQLLTEDKEPDDTSTNTDVLPSQDFQLDIDNFFDF
jgi:hypothetical protein